MALSGNRSNYSPELRKHLDRIAFYVMRAFGVSPPDSPSLEKAAARAREGLLLASGRPANSPDAAVIPTLTLLLEEFNGRKREPVPSEQVAQGDIRHSGAVPIARGESALRSAAGEQPSQEPTEGSVNIGRRSSGLARTMPLSLRFPETGDPPPPSAPAAPLPWPPSVVEAPYPAPVPRSTEPPLQPPFDSPPPSAPDSPIAIVVAEPNRTTPSKVVGRLEDLHASRQALLENPLASWGEFKPLAAALDEALSDARTSREDGRTLEGAPVTASISALRLSADLPTLERADATSKESPGGVRVEILVALANHRRLSADRLLPFLGDPSDAVAARAAQILAWIGRPPADRNTLLRRLKKPGTSPNLRSAFLLAAAALGSTSALKELRDLLDAGRQPVTALAIDALAVGGNRSDVDRLLALAARQIDLASLAVLAAGHLGSVAAIDAIARTKVPDPIKERAVRTIIGDGTTRGAHPQPQRCLYGSPWTVAGALDRLAAPDELLHSRLWYALEAMVRTGVRTLAWLDLAAPLATQERVVTAIRASLIPPRRWFPAGDWLFHGRRIA